MPRASVDVITYQLWRCQTPCEAPTKVLFRDHPEDVRCNGCFGRLVYAYPVQVPTPDAAFGVRVDNQGDTLANPEE